MDDHLKPVVGGENLVRLDDNAADVRFAASALEAQVRGICRVLAAPGSHPLMRQKAKDALVDLSKEALNLWSKL